MPAEPLSSPPPASPPVADRPTTVDRKPVRVEPSPAAPAPAPDKGAATPDASRSRRRRRASAGKDGKVTAPAAAAKAPRTTRAVVRRVDPWAVLKVSVLFYLSMFLVILAAAVLLWVVASSAGVVDNIEDFMSSIGFTDFRFLPGQLFRAAALGGLVLVVAGTAGNVLLTLLYNMLADVVGGVSITLTDDSRRAHKHA